MAGERANDREAHIHQAHWWQIRRLRVEGGRTYVLLQKSGGRPERKGVASKSRDLRSDQRQKSQPCWPSGRQQE